MAKKANGYWTLDRVLEAAKGFSTLTEFQKGNTGAAYAAYTKKWIKQLHKVLPPTQNPRGFWTKCRVHKEAKKYTARREFYLGSGAAYYRAQVNGWLDEVCSHMEELKKPKGYWTRRRVIDEAKKHQYISDWRMTCPSSYKVARENGWLSVCTKHMTRKRNPRKSFWTLKKILVEAKKFKTIIEFRKSNPGAYDYAYTNGWLPKVRETIGPGGKRVLPRFVYVHRFLDQDGSCEAVYVGISHDLKIRTATHRLRSKWKSYFEDYRCQTYVYGPYEATDAASLEKAKIARYRKRKFNVLNVSNGGAMGSAA